MPTQGGVAETRPEIDANKACPCGSAKTAGSCCLRLFPVRKTDGSLVPEPIIVVPYTRPTPSGPRTGRKVSGCYASYLADCDGPLSNEHFISHRALQRLAGVEGLLYATGIDPKAPQTKKRLPTKSIAAPVLCRRHNGALLPIDTAGNRFFAAVSDASDFFARANPGDAVLTAVSGLDFERWCLKALCGFVARTGRLVPELWVRILFGECDVLKPRGLHVFANVGELLSGNDIKLEELIHDGEAVGLIVTLRQYEFVLSMHPEIAKGAPRHREKIAVRRPGLFYMTGQNGATVALSLSWPDYDLHYAVFSNWAEGNGTVTT